MRTPRYAPFRRVSVTNHRPQLRDFLYEFFGSPLHAGKQLHREYVIMLPPPYLVLLTPQGLRNVWCKSRMFSPRFPVYSAQFYKEIFRHAIGYLRRHLGQGFSSLEQSDPTNISLNFSRVSLYREDTTVLCSLYIV